MLKGFFKWDEETIFWGVFGAALGAAAATQLPAVKGKKLKTAHAAAGGALAGLGVRAATDPSLKAARKAGSTT